MIITSVETNFEGKKVDSVFSAKDQAKLIFKPQETALINGPEDKPSMRRDERSIIKPFLKMFAIGEIGALLRVSSVIKGT